MSDYNALAGGRRIQKVVLIESSVATPPAKILQSNLWMIQAADGDPKILAVVGNLDTSQTPDTFAQQVRQLAAHRTWVGIRVGGGIFQANAVRIIDNLKPNVLTNLKFLAEKGLMIDALGIKGEVLRTVGAAIPGLTIVMDHFAGKATRFDVEESWKSDMQQASACESIHIKVSDVHKLSSQSVTGAPAGLAQFRAVADPKPYEETLAFLWSAFGADRLIFGTNWPVSDAGGLKIDSIDVQIDILEAFLAGKGTGRDKVMSANALRVYSPRKTQAAH